LYDATGKQLKKIRTKDAEDLSGVSDFSLIDDNRIKRHHFYHRVYPYTVEYTTEIEYSSTLFFPRWVPQGREQLSVEKSSFAVVAPAGYTFRYKAFNYQGAPLITTEKEKIVSTWSVKHMPAILREPYSPLWHELTTVVIFGPTDFQVEDYKGNMASWSDFGKFVYALKQGRDVLPDHIRQQVHQLTDGLSDVKKRSLSCMNISRKIPAISVSSWGSAAGGPLMQNLLQPKHMAIARPSQIICSAC